MKEKLKEAVFHASVDRVFDEVVSFFLGRKTTNSETGIQETVKTEKSKEGRPKEKIESRGANKLLDEILTEDAKALAQNQKLAQRFGLKKAEPHEIRLLDEIMAELSIGERDKVTNFFGNRAERFMNLDLSNSRKRVQNQEYEHGIDHNVRGALLILSIVNRSRLTPEEIQTLEEEERTREIEFLFKQRVKNCLLADGAFDTVTNRLKEAIEKTAGFALTVVNSVEAKNIRKTKRAVRDWRKRMKTFRQTA
ncbi:hypothetical protein GF382_01420 [Candidatus Falkowbacteria bacterium]|nr:hypothetical protein [Candidatus Falkowbacteria bacterium]